MVINPNHNYVTFFVCLQCQRHCSECSQQPLMNWKPKYQMSLEEIEKFIKVTKDSGYDKFKWIIISGGEPLLWNNLEEGLSLLKKSKIANAIKIFSNGINVSKITYKVLINSSVIRVSQYKENWQILQDLKRQYKNKIEIVDRTVHTKLPTKLYDNVLPAKCHCQGYAVCDNKIYACPMIPAICRKLNFDIEYFCPIIPHWVEALDLFNRENEYVCQGCIGNLKVREKIK